MVGPAQRADTTPGASQLPADDGRTRWFVLVAEDATSCPSPAGYGNLSGASGPVPGALYDLAGPGEPDGRLRVPCCQFEVSQGVGTFGPDPLRLTANRTSPEIAWVEFRDQLSGEVLGRHHFGNANQVSVVKSFVGPARIVDLRPLEPETAIGPEHLEPALTLLRPDEIVLLCTGWGDLRARTELWLKQSPFLGQEGARWLVERKVRGVGIDQFVALVGSGTKPVASCKHADAGGFLVQGW